MQYELTQKDRALIDHLMSDKEAFNAFVYTPWQEAVEEIARRDSDSHINAYLSDVWHGDVPFFLKQNSRNLVLCRHIATPSYELNRFLQIADVLRSFHPLIMEFAQDKYVNINHSKHALGNLCFYRHNGMSFSPTLEYRSIIHKGDSNGKALNTLSTHWGEGLVAFHHRLLSLKFPHFKYELVDVSDHLGIFGINAAQYYYGYLSFFMKSNIMLDNLLLDAEEAPFMRKVLLPTIIRIFAETNKKPILVRLGPSGDEENPFWYSYDPDLLSFVDKRLSAASSNLLQLS